jgi:hypothetical protein
LHRYPNTFLASFKCPCLGAAESLLREEIANVRSKCPATISLCPALIIC